MDELSQDSPASLPESPSESKSTVDEADKNSGDEGQSVPLADRASSLRPTQESGLLPCPFCLGPADITSVVGGDEGDGYVWHVFCAEDNDCAMMPDKYAESERTARQWWNLRAESDQAKAFVFLVDQLCRDLNEAHNEILRQQGVPASDFGKYDWPEWTPQANSIRWAERILKIKLAKTNHWTLYPIPQAGASVSALSQDVPDESSVLHVHCWHTRTDAPSFCCGCENLTHSDIPESKSGDDRSSVPLPSDEEFRAMLTDADNEITRLKQAIGWIVDAADAAYLEDENNTRVHEIFNIAAKAGSLTRRLPDENHPLEL